MERKSIAFIAFTMLLSSIQVQAAHAMELVPDVNVETQAAVTAETSKDIKLTVPVSDRKVQNQEAAPAVAPKVVVKRRWSRATSPDLVTQAERSSEPVVRTMIVPATAYTSNFRECDSTPFVTANGTQVRDGIVASNFLRFGTRFRIPDYFGDKVFEVHDRMSPRYNGRIDIWMLNKADAKAWGKRHVKIEILN